MSVQPKPLSKVKTFCIARTVCAWIGHDMLVEEWEVERVHTHAPAGSAEWHAAAFEAACIAFKRLQQRLPARDLVWSAERTPVGRNLQLNKSITHYLLPYVAG